MVLHSERTTSGRAPAPAAATAALGGLFAVYLALLVGIILFKLEPPHLGDPAIRAIKIMPFARTDANGPSAPLEVLANLVLFVPFGVYLGALAPRWSSWRRIGAVALTSVMLEVAQYVLAVGRTDVTDVIVNTAGGLVGIGLWAGCRGRARRVLVRVLVVATVGLVLASALFIASPVRFA